VDEWLFAQRASSEARNVETGATGFTRGVSTSSNLLPHISLPAPTQQNKDSLREKARAALNASSTNLLHEENPLIKYRADGAGQWRWRRVIGFTLLEESAEKGIVAEIDLDTRALLGLLNLRHEQSSLRPKVAKLNKNISGTIQGRGVKFDPTITGTDLDILPLENLFVNDESLNETQTKEDGKFIFPLKAVAIGTFSPQKTISGALKGHFAEINSLFIPTLSFEEPVQYGVPKNILLNPSGAEEFSTAQVNAYYHTNIIHDWLRDLAGNFMAIDMALPTFVNEDATCNAYYTNVPFSQIHYYKKAGPCNNSAFDTVIYHEYGHFSDDMAGGIQTTNAAFGLSEGWGDTLACYITAQPFIGENFYLSGDFIRTCDNQYQYPGLFQEENEEVHSLGQAWAGFSWHLREQLMAQYGPEEGDQIASNLILTVLIANPASIPDAVLETVLADDPDGDLSNGTPHLDEIVAAATQHSLFPFLTQDAVFSSPGPFDVFIPGNQITISGTIENIISGIPLQDYQIFYSLGNDPTLIPITSPLPPPANTTFNHTWTIPSTPMGVIYDLHLTMTTTNGLKFQAITPIFVSIALPIPLANSGFKEDHAGISGNYVVWDKQADASLTNYNIYYYDITTQVTTQVTDEPVIQKYPAIGGNKIVWQDCRNGTKIPFITDCTNPDIYLYNIDTGVEIPITTHPADQRYPLVSGNTVIWWDCRNGSTLAFTGCTNWDIYSYDITSGVETQITSSPVTEYTQDIDGNYVAYVRDWGNGQEDIFLYNLLSQEEQQITDDEFSNEFADIDGNNMVWENIEENSIYFRNILTQETTKIIDPISWSIWNLSLSGDNLVWSDTRNGSWDIFKYNLTTQTEVQLTGGLFNETQPGVAGNHAVWVQDYCSASWCQTNNVDVYMIEF
jgi:beta propeller repeat protein